MTVCLHLKLICFQPLLADLSYTERTERENCASELYTSSDTPQLCGSLILNFDYYPKIRGSHTQNKTGCPHQECEHPH